MTRNLPKIAIVMSEGLPVPAVRGGAVENLVQVLLDENEKTPAFEFTVFSVADALAEERSRAYAHARFFFFPKGEKPLFRWVAKHLVPSAFYPGDPFIAAIAEKMCGETFDAIVVENAPRYAIALRKLFPRTPILHHFHNRKLWRGCRYERKITAASDAYICVSDYIRRDVLTSRRVAPESVFRCLNGIDVAHFSAPISRERRAARHRRAARRVLARRKTHTASEAAAPGRKRRRTRHGGMARRSRVEEHRVHGTRSLLGNAEGAEMRRRRGVAFDRNRSVLARPRRMPMRRPADNRDGLRGYAGNRGRRRRTHRSSRERASRPPRRSDGDARRRF